LDAPRAVDAAEQFRAHEADRRRTLDDLAVLIEQVLLEIGWDTASHWKHAVHTECSIRRAALARTCQMRPGRGRTEEWF
jgi:hypothetical protein